MLLILIHFVLFSFDLVGFGLVYGLVWFSLVCWVWIVRLQCSLVYSAWFSLVTIVGFSFDFLGLVHIVSFAVS